MMRRAERRSRLADDGAVGVSGIKWSDTRLIHLRHKQVGKGRGGGGREEQWACCLPTISSAQLRLRVRWMLLLWSSMKGLCGRFFLTFSSLSFSFLTTINAHPVSYFHSLLSFLLFFSSIYLSIYHFVKAVCACVLGRWVHE